ncbi:uncharacterized protein [Fopius arisanus]|uniref:CysS_2 protein n=1 Tax=Fopius arisanus TaxID=64838 RepID=A0A0C9RKU3_9HYME|nr:PREDICTED: uncharacterized protein LOC105267939 [Fopius arisanus]XP_011305437.1 PREDICTED: uncharacterized protein LOC105267939 [Fopius arisanus]XP_011305438.1 PREDICTED: uncharacterized protein LOC105267939 [Fopius arisanus]
MDPIKQLFYTEQYEKQNRNIKLVEEFIALPKKKSVTSKFYSKYERVRPEEVPVEYIKLIEKFTESVPRNIYDYQPPMMNMDYGWFNKPLIPNSTDSRLHFPLKQCEVVKTEIRIRETDKGLPREKFVGVPFYL